MPRFRTLPPADVAYRSEQMRALLATAFTGEAKPRAHGGFPCDCCDALTIDRSGERPLRCSACTEHGCQPFERPRCLVPADERREP